MHRRIPKITFLIKEIQHGLRNSADAYLRTGLTLCEKIEVEEREGVIFPLTPFQIAIGNLSISIELMLKTTIANKCFPFLYQGLPKELQLHLFYPDIFENQSHAYVNELKSFSDKFKTIELNEAIGLFYNLYPQEKDYFQPYFISLSQFRNNSVHAFIPGHDIYILGRIKYLALSLYRFLLEEHIFTSLMPGDIIYRNLPFTEVFERDLNSKVTEKVKKSKERSKGLRNQGNTPVIPAEERWDKYIISCEICHSDAILNGKTEFTPEREYESDGEYFVLMLDFRASSFHCEICGLKLEDPKELDLVGISKIYSRNDEVDEWMEANGIDINQLAELVK